MGFYLVLGNSVEKDFVNDFNQLFFEAIQFCDFDSSIIYHGSQHVLVGLKNSSNRAASSIMCNKALLRISFSVDKILNCPNNDFNRNIQPSTELCEPINTCWLHRPDIFKNVSASVSNKNHPKSFENEFAVKILGVILDSIIKQKDWNEFSIRSRESQLNEILLGSRVQSLSDLVFGVSTSSLSGYYLLPSNSIYSNRSTCTFRAQYLNFELMNRYNGSVSSLDHMSKSELMHYILGYFTDLLTMSQQLNQFPLDVHPGNQLYSKPLQGNMRFLWTDFGASSSGKSSLFVNTTTIKHTSTMYKVAFGNFYVKASSFARNLNWASLQTVLERIMSLHGSVQIDTNAVTHFQNILHLIQEFMTEESKKDSELINSVGYRINPAVGFFLNLMNSTIVAQNSRISELIDFNVALNFTIVAQNTRISELIDFNVALNFTIVAQNSRISKLIDSNAAQDTRISELTDNNAALNFTVVSQNTRISELGSEVVKLNALMQKFLARSPNSKGLSDGKNELNEEL